MLEILLFFLWTYLTHQWVDIFDFLLNLSDYRQWYQQQNDDSGCKDSKDNGQMIENLMKEDIDIRMLNDCFDTLRAIYDNMVKKISYYLVNNIFHKLFHAQNVFVYHNNLQIAQNRWINFFLNISLFHLLSKNCGCSVCKVSLFHQKISIATVLNVIYIHLTFNQSTHHWTCIFVIPKLN